MPDPIGAVMLIESGQTYVYLFYFLGFSFVATIIHFVFCLIETKKTEGKKTV